MNFLRSTASAIGIFSLSATLAQGQAVLTFEDLKNFRVVGPEQSEFEGGSWNLGVIDGAVPVLGCFANGGVFFQPPALGCAAGTTGLVTVGDFDQDGIRDTGLFFSVMEPTPAINIEPFQTDLVEFASGPPSDLPRPIGGFNWVDNSVIVFFDLVNDPRNGIGFEVTQYQSTRPFGVLELERQRDEIVPGVYRFNFPALGSDEDEPASFIMVHGHREMVEAFPGPGGRSVSSSGISVGNDFLLLNDDAWNDGVMEFDPRIVFEFQWEGFNPQTFLPTDRLFFAARDRVTDNIVFPPFPPVDPPNPESSQLIGGISPLGVVLDIPTGYELGPNFFQPGDAFTVELEFRRNLMVGNTIDTSVRFFRWDVDLVDTFEGFQALAFPILSDTDLIEPDADFDGDGFTNLEEFGLQTDPIDPASVPNPTPVLTDFTNQCLLEVEKRPFVGSLLTYIIEYSFDGENFFPVVPGDPNFFLLFDNDEAIAVLSQRPITIDPCFTRVRIEQN